jgi:hypothetical protein
MAGQKRSRIITRRLLVDLVQASGRFEDLDAVAFSTISGREAAGGSGKQRRAAGMPDL